MMLLGVGVVIMVVAEALIGKNCLDFNKGLRYLPSNEGNN